MKLLILGGTIFVGRHLVGAAQARGHEVTLFNRGQHNADLFADLEKIHGDRDGGLNALKGRNWDAVIDTCGYVPRVVRQAADQLAGQANHYTFISSISVFSDYTKPDMDEAGPVGILDDPTVETIDGGTYGPLKALCEQEVERAFPGHALNIRPGLIVGPYDPTDRFTYWPVRINRGGTILTPQNHDVGVQIIDGRDLAEWNIRMIEQQRAGVYNATGPAYRMSFGEMLAACPKQPGVGTDLVHVSEDWLTTKEVHAWSDLPSWVPDSPEMRGFSSINCDKAIRDGLTFRPIIETARDTLDWASTRPADYELRAGLKPERERQLLAEWRESANRSASPA